MIRRLPVEKMGESNLGWLRSKFHFSFAEYFNENNINFGVLRVINDDHISAGTGFDTHPHRDMEIITYVVHGYLTHKDSMGNESTLSRGQVQYMSAGTGVRHSEYNNHSEELRLLQIWVLPDRKGHTPNYGEYKFGSRNESVIFSVQTLLVKSASAVSGWLIGIGLSLVGYVANVQQTASAIMGIRSLMIIFPMLLSAMGYVIYKKYYKLNDEYYDEIIEKLAEKRANA